MLIRKTTISVFVINLLKESNSPLSVLQIMEKLKQANLTPNKTTIYRILEKLVQKKTFNEVSLRNGVTYYEFSKGHHHHFACNQCELVFCLDACHVHSHKIDLNALLPNKKFKINSHDFNLYGLCEPCSAK